MAHDYMLLALIDIAEGKDLGVLGDRDPQGFSFPVTINVHGILMAGYVIGSEEYFKIMAKALGRAEFRSQDGMVIKDKDAAAAKTKEMADRLNLALKVQGDPVVETAKPAYEGPAGERMPAQRTVYARDIKYLHLKKVDVLNFQGGGVVEHAAWRVNLDDISAFALGHPKTHYDMGSGCNYQPG